MQKLSSPIDLIKKSIDIFREKENLTFFLKIYLPVLIISLFQFSSNNSGITTKLQKGDLSFLPTNIYLIIFIILLVVASLIFSIWFQATSVESVIRVVNGGVLDFKDTYKKAWTYTVKLALANLVVALIFIGGFILLVIPAFIFMVWYGFTQFIIAEGEVSVKSALSKSKELVKGKFWAVAGRIAAFGIFGFLVQIILGVIPFGIGSMLSTLIGALFIIPSFLLYQELLAANS